MNRFILIYVYNSPSDGGLIFWERLNAVLNKKGFKLYLLLLSNPNREVSFSYSLFTEKLDNVVCPKGFNKKYKSTNFQPFLDREETWYGKSDKDRLTAAKFQKYKYTKLLEELNPCLLVLGNGQHAGDLILNKEANILKIPVVYIERGSLPKSWHIDKFGITAGTGIAKKSLNEICVSNDVSSYLKYKNYYLKSKFTWWQQPENHSNSNIRERFKIDANKKIILFANQLDNDTSNFLYSPFFKSNLEAFSWFCKSIKKANLKDYFILVKKHPYYSSDDYLFKDVLQNNNVEGLWVNDISLDHCIAQSDLVCAVNSTLLFESLIYEKPVLQLGNSLLDNKGIVYQIKNITDINTVINWYNKIDFKIKLTHFNEFMTYMIEYELAFFFDDVEEVGLNYVDFFIERMKPFINMNNKGRAPKKFLKLNSKDQNESFKIKMKLRKIYNFVSKRIS